MLVKIYFDLPIPMMFLYQFLLSNPPSNMNYLKCIGLPKPNAGQISEKVHFGDNKETILPSLTK